MNLTPRQQLAEKIAAIAKASGANVTSISPLHPDDSLNIEAMPEVAASISSMLAGYVLHHSIIRRLVPNARTETIRYRLEDGTETQRVEIHAGEVDLVRVEVRIPNERPPILGPSSKSRLRQKHRRRVSA